MDEKRLAELETKVMACHPANLEWAIGKKGVLELIAELRRLGFELELSENRYGSLRMKLDSIETENKKSRKALEFYADGMKWWALDVIDEKLCDTLDMHSDGKLLLEDNGKIAREALRGGGE